MTILDNLTPDQQLELVYVGYYNRAAEPAGFVYWESQYASALNVGQSPTGAINNIANSFGAPTQTETTGLYPFLGQTNPNYNDPVIQGEVNNLINNIFLNLFNRPADDDGKAYWANQLETGQVGLGQIILDIANGAQPGSSDYNLLMNKVSTALTFTEQAAAAGYGESEPMPQGFATEAHYVLTLDTATDTKAAADEISNFIHDVGANLPYDETVIDLTTAIDNVVGAGTHNLFVGTLGGGGDNPPSNDKPEALAEKQPDGATTGTLNPGDSITGAGFDNTLKIVTTGDPAIDLNSVSISYVQNLVIFDASHALGGDAYVGADNAFSNIEVINANTLNLYQVNEGTKVAYQALGGGGNVAGHVYFNATSATSVTMNDTVSGAPNMTGGLDVAFYHGEQGAGLSAAQNISATLNVANLQIAGEDGAATADQYIYADTAGNAGATIDTTLNVVDNASDGSGLDYIHQYVYQTGDARVNAVVNVSNTVDADVHVYANFDSNVVADAANNAATINLSNVSGFHGNAAVGAYGFDAVTVNVNGDANLTNGLFLDEDNSTATSSNAQKVTIDAAANLEDHYTDLDYNGSTALTVEGSGNVDLGFYSASGSTALSAAVSATIDASALTGGFSVEVVDAINSVKGGAGNDVILLDSVSTFGDAAEGGLVADGGAGVNTIGFKSAGWTDTISTGASAALAGIVNFQTLEITDTLPNGSTYDVSALAGSHIVNFTAGDGVTDEGTATVTHLGDGAMVTIEGALQSGQNDGMLNVTLTTASLAPTLSLVLDGDYSDNDNTTHDATTNIENLTTSGVANVNADSTGTDTSLPFTPGVGYVEDTATNDLTLADAALVKLTVTGDQRLSFTATAGETKLTTIDAHQNAGGLTVDVSGIAGTQALSITGTAGSDFIIVGAGANSLTLDGGADTVTLATPSASSAIFTTINDIISGDKIVFNNTTTVANATGALGAALISGVSDYQTFLNEGASKAAGTVSWFEFGGNTFVEVSGTGGGAYTAGSDSVTEFVGLHNLANSTITTGTGGALTIV